MKIINPATGQLVADVPVDEPGAVADKVTRARAAQPAWAGRTLDQRMAVIRRFRDALIANVDRLALTLCREMGKPISQARHEIKATPARIDFFLAHTAAVLASEVVWRDPEGSAGRLDEVIEHEPLGVVANISAWNYPYFVGSNVFVPALLTGNAVVYKPSESATLTGLAIAELLHESGVPQDVFSVVVGAGDVGATLLQQPIDAVFFTGSYATGLRIAGSAAARLIKVQLELGGKDPTYVCDDVDPAAAAASLADGAFYNTGQSCCSVERLYVHRRVAGPFIDALVNQARGFAVGDPEDEGTYIGPLARHAQLDLLDEQVRDARILAGEVRCGGARLPGPGWFFAPTVIANATNAMKVMREESFGPIIGVQIVDDDDEALTLMNDNDYGLTAGVYSRDRSRAESLLRRVNAGSVYWNCCDRVSPRLPWTGRKRSGLGSTLSTHGIRTFLTPKAWHLRAF